MGGGISVSTATTTKRARPPRGAAAQDAKPAKDADTKSESSVVSNAFSKVSRHISRALGSPWMFVIAVAIIVVWALLGPVAGFSDTWQLVINTGTTIVTFLMVFLIQNTQNR